MAWLGEVATDWFSLHQSLLCHSYGHTASTLRRIMIWRLAIVDTIFRRNDYSLSYFTAPETSCVRNVNLNYCLTFVLVSGTNVTESSCFSVILTWKIPDAQEEAYRRWRAKERGVHQRPMLHWYEAKEWRLRFTATFPASLQRGWDWRRSSAVWRLQLHAVFASVYPLGF